MTALSLAKEVINNAVVFFSWMMIKMMKFMVFRGKVSLHSIGWPGTHYFFEAGLELMEVCLLLQTFDF